MRQEINRVSPTAPALRVSSHAAAREQPDIGGEKGLRNWGENVGKYNPSGK